MKDAHQSSTAAISTKEVRDPDYLGLVTLTTLTKY